MKTFSRLLLTIPFAFIAATTYAAQTDYHLLKEIPVGGAAAWDYLSVDEAGRIYDNLEDKSEVVAIDMKTHEVVNHWPIAPGEGASGMAIDLAHHRLFLGCGNNLMVMMDSASGKVVDKVPIGSRVDANAFD